jgi:hypothetical protein
MAEKDFSAVNAIPKTSGSWAGIQKNPVDHAGK